METGFSLTSSCEEVVYALRVSRKHLDSATSDAYIFRLDEDSIHSLSNQIEDSIYAKN